MGSALRVLGARGISYDATTTFAGQRPSSTTKDEAHRLSKLLSADGTVEEYVYDRASNLLRAPGLSARMQTGSYRKQKQKRAGKLDRDHIPSKAAVKRAMKKQLGRKLSKRERKNLENNLTSVAVDRKGVHQPGRTYGNKNTDDQINRDSRDLRKAANSDLGEHRGRLKDAGHSDADVKSTEKAIHDRNEAIGVYNKPMPLSLLQGGAE